MAEKYLREIEENLEKTDGDVVVKAGPRPRSQQRRRGLATGGTLGRLRVAIAPGKLMFASVAVLLSALLLGQISAGLMGFALWGALILFLVGYALFFITPRGTPKRWRGSVIEEPTSPMSRLRRMFRR